MKRIFFIAMMLFVNVAIAQPVVLNFDGYLTFKCTDKNVSGYDIVSSPAIEYVSIGFGKNHVTFDFEEKIIVNKYYVRDDYAGTITYDNLTNYVEIDGVSTFQATRIHPETKKPYTEYFVINEHALTTEYNSPYLITYWFEDGIMVGNIINRDLLY